MRTVNRKIKVHSKSFKDVSNCKFSLMSDKVEDRYCYSKFNLATSSENLNVCIYLMALQINC